MWGVINQLVDAIAQLLQLTCAIVGGVNGGEIVAIGGP